MTESGTENQEIDFETIYKIRNGFCLIINIINFDEREDLRRNGSEENVKLIKEAFQLHRFQVQDYYHLTHHQIISLIDEEVDNQKCNLYDAFVLYIHIHGIEDTILCKNSYQRNQHEIVLTNVIHFEQIVELFKDENCQLLRNKPKLIFFDCCRKGYQKLFHFISFIQINSILFYFILFIKSN